MRQPVKDFQAGKTFYSDTQWPISLQDLPTLTICWEIYHSVNVVQYDRAFIVDVKIADNEKTKTISFLSYRYNIFEFNSTCIAIIT